MVPFLGNTQNSYKAKELLEYYTEALLAFENEEYPLANEYFERVLFLDKQKTPFVEVYKLLTDLEIDRKNAAYNTEMYLKNNLFTTQKTVLVLALSNYYFQKKQSSKALSWFKEIDVKVLTEEQETNYNYKLAFANYKVKKYTKAKEYLLPLSKNGAYQKEAHYYLGNIAMQNKDYVSAKYHLDKIKGEKKYEKEVVYQTLVVLYQQKKYEEAILLGEDYYEKTSGVEQSEVAKILGESYFYLESYDKAADYLVEYKGRQRKLTVVDYYFLGYAYYKQTDYNKAIENFNKITDEKSSVAQNAHYHLGDCYLKKNQKTQALNAFKNASEMSFDVDIQQDAFLNYAKLSYEIGNPYKSSSKVLQDFIDTYPNSKETSVLEGLIVNAYLQLKDFDGAIDYYKKQRLIKDNQYQEILLEKGFELFNNRKLQDALSCFSQASEMYNNKKITNRALFWKAETLSELNNYKEAAYYYNTFVNNKVNKEEKEHTDGVYGLAYSLFQQKKYKDALVHFNKYVNISEKSVKKDNAILRIADCNYVSKNYLKALENYNQIIKENKAQRDYAMHQKALAYGFLGKKEEKQKTLIRLQNTFDKSAYLDDSYYELGNLLVSKNKNGEAIKAYDDLIENFPKSSLVAKAKLKKGTVLFNSNQNENSIRVLRDLVKTYPGTGEAVQAVKIAEQVYKEMDKVEVYATWVKQLEFVNVSDQDIDKSMFEAAENKYLANDLKAGTTSCKKYLINFPKGIHALTVHFYLAQSYYNLGNKEMARPQYEEVLKVNTNEYTEVSLNRLSQIYLENEEWALASALLLQIEKESTNNQSIVYAQSNLMKFYYKESKFLRAMNYTDKVLGNSNSSEQAVADAYVYGARSSVKLKNDDTAKKYYQKLENIGVGSVKAEANYYKALWLHNDDFYEKSNEQIQVLTSKYQAYKYWGIKGLLLMAQNFHALEDDFQANFILNNIITNASEFKDITEEVQVLLNKYESKTKKLKTEDKLLNNTENEK